MKRNAIAVTCAAMLAIVLLLPAALMGKLQPESAVRDTIKYEVSDSSASQQAPTFEQQGQPTEEATDSSDTTVEVITRKSLTVRLEIYMCDTSDVATVTDADMDAGTTEE